MMLKKFFYVAAIVLLTAGLLSGCGKSGSDQYAAAGKDTLVRGNGAEPPSLDPAIMQDVNSAQIAYDLYEGLTDFNQSNQPVPGIAQSWDISSNGKVYTFHLRPNAKWSNGEPLTAQDFLYSWQRTLDPKTASPYAFVLFPVVNAQEINAGKMPLSSLGAKVIDAHTFQVTLKRPVSYFLQVMTQPATYPVYAPSIKKYGNAFVQPGNSVTDGAYMMAAWVPNGYIDLVKNPYYYDAADVKIDKVKYLPIVDTNSELSQYKSGAIDVTYTVPVDQYKQIAKEYPTELHTVAWTGNYYYDFGLLHAPFKNNLKLRQALSMTVDRDAIATQVLGQEQIPMYTMIPSDIENGAFSALKPYEWQSLPYAEKVSEAQKLFAQAGYSTTHPLNVTISYNTNDIHKKVALAIASMWQQAFGSAIKVELNNQEWSVIIQAKNKGDFQIMRDGWIADFDTADNFTELLMCANPQNTSHYCSPKYDQLINEAESTTNPAERVKLIEQAQTLMLNDYPVIPLLQYTYFRLVKPYVKGYDPTNNHLDHVHSKWFYFDYGK